HDDDVRRERGQFLQGGIAIRKTAEQLEAGGFSHHPAEHFPEAGVVFDDGDGAGHGAQIAAGWRARNIHRSASSGTSIRTVVPSAELCRSIFPPVSATR